VFYPAITFEFVKVLLGGTFSVLHKAHRIMISRGLQVGELIIGITSDSFNFRKELHCSSIREKEGTGGKVSPEDRGESDYSSP